MTTLTDDLQPIKRQISDGDLVAAATFLAAYGVLKPSLRRQAKARMPAMVFNQHPRFRALGSRMFAWPEEEREIWSAQIERVADLPDRLPSIVSFFF